MHLFVPTDVQRRVYGRELWLGTEQNRVSHSDQLSTWLAKVETDTGALDELLANAHRFGECPAMYVYVSQRDLREMYSGSARLWRCVFCYNCLLADCDVRA